MHPGRFGTMNVRYLLIPALTALLTGCGPTIDYSVRVSHAPVAEGSFEKLETYEWVPLSKTVDTASFGTDFLVSMKIAFTDAIEAKGYRRAKEGADLLVALYVSKNGRIISSDWGWGYQWDQQAWDGYWMERRVSAKEVGEGTLVLDILDSRKKELIWSGTAQAVVLPGASAAKWNERIDEAVEKLLAKLPSP
jgi:hypothetical protein